MPTLSAGDKVLMIGVNGFIAAWVVRKFLEKGYAVRGSVRSADKGTFLQKLFKSYGDKFKIVVVEDFTKEGAFNEAIQGVHGIAHTTSPANLTAASVEEMIEPAVGGTLGILKSAAKHGVIVVLHSDQILSIQGFTTARSPAPPLPARIYQLDR